MGSIYDDRITGTGAANYLDGYPGDDVIVGGPGQDEIDGNSENDTIYVRDGERDTVYCGIGIDTVVADSPGTDELNDCETKIFPSAAPQAAPASALPMTPKKCKKNANAVGVFVDTTVRIRNK